MPLKFIKKRLLNWDQHSIIAPPSQELKSTSAKERGEFCEDLVLQYFLSQNYRLIKRNKKISGVEVDLLFFSSHYVIVEVKSLSTIEQLPFRLTKYQKQRLLWARESWQSYKDEPVQLVVAYVTGENEILTLDIIDH